MATLAEERGKNKYQQLDALHMFVPFSVETIGVFGLLTRDFLKDIGRIVFLATEKQMSRYHLTECVSVTTQKGNTALVMGTSGYF